MTLAELGERALVRELLLPLLRRAEPSSTLDDCAMIPLDESTTLLLTTDAGPQESFLLNLNIGTPEDFGHFSATMSLSDIAAMGGQPLALVAACILPPTFGVSQFEQLTQGLILACAEVGASYVGGDTKEGAQPRIITTAVGVCPSADLLRRGGARPGDVLCSSGMLGRSLANYLVVARSKRLWSASPFTAPTPGPSCIRKANRRSALGDLMHRHV